MTEQPESKRSRMIDCSFPKEARILKRGDFLRVQNTGRRIHGPHLMGFVRSARESQPNGFPERRMQNRSDNRKAPPPRPRLGITVTTKIHKRSHERNRIKRALREAFRRHQHTVIRGIEVVVSARPGCVTLTGPQLQHELFVLLSRARLIGVPQGSPSHTRHGNRNEQ
jgi:ribonuclease P protein component